VRNVTVDFFTVIKGIVSRDFVVFSLKSFDRSEVPTNKERVR
jgi:hypothetical protein